MRSSWITFIAPIFIFSTVSCGVKGKPMPPLTAPPIGRGQPTMAQPEEVSPSKTPAKKTRPAGNSQ